MGFSCCSGIGAGVVWSFASLAASDDVDDFELDRPVRLRYSVTRKEVEGCEENWPCPSDAGQREGTASWRAFRDACSPMSD